MFLEVGPASLVVNGEKQGAPYDFNRFKLEEKIRNILEDIKEYLPILKQKAYKIKNTKHLPDVPRIMVEAVKTIDEMSLTPMAAVAGSVSDALKEFIKGEGLDNISINNGGDISVFDSCGKGLKVGIGDIHTGETSPYTISIYGLTDYGLATSGFGGRSFTLGLADSVTVVAATGAVADAAATFLCNNTNTYTDQVRRKKAIEIDPLTDIPDEYVTIEINKLSEEIITESLEKGFQLASNIKHNKHIYDAIIRLKDRIVTTINGDYPITLEVHNGN
ncbi:MAG: FAD:protein FMN transferase [Syntrophorhabdus sp.]